MNLLENIHAEGNATLKIKEGLKQWNIAQDYYDSSWNGIEKFHMQIAKYTKSIAIESAGWYKYPSSNRSDMDGKDWRLIIPDKDRKATVVNCHSLLHDGVWTLTTTTYSTDDIDVSKLQVINDSDPWKRSMYWTVQLTHLLESEIYNYEDARNNMHKRLSQVDDLHRIKTEIIVQLEMVYQHLFAIKPNIPRYITIALNDWSLIDDKAGSYIAKSDLGILTINPSAFEKKGYVEDIIKHELIHAAIGPEQKGHGYKFQTLAKAMNLPEKYRD